MGVDAKNFLPKAILFDHDGVLVSSETLHERAWKQIFSDLGLDIHKIGFYDLVGHTATQILQKIFSRFGLSTVGVDLEAIAHRKNDIYLALAQTELAPYPGVREGLEFLKAQGIPCAVVSNAKRRELEFSVERLQLRDYFERIFSRDDVPEAKPSPMAYTFAANALGFLPQECLAIDDTPTGLTSALLAGCVTWSVETSMPAERLRQPVLGRADLKTAQIFKSMQDLMDALKSHFSRAIYN